MLSVLVEGTPDAQKPLALHQAENVAQHGTEHGSMLSAYKALSTAYKLDQPSSEAIKEKLRRLPIIGLQYLHGQHPAVIDYMALQTKQVTNSCSRTLGEATRSITMSTFHLFEAKWTHEFRAATRNYRIIIDKLCRKIESHLRNELDMRQKAPDAVPCIYDY